MARHATATPPNWWKFSLIAFAAATVWAALSYIEFRDGTTWVTRSRHESGPYIQFVDARIDPSKFALAAVFRGVLPVVFLGTMGSVLLLAAFGQRIQERS
ncbi:hypothetical protein GVN24_31885 [Rhizobium sp. CRIBSB]|nr:hypothetical protein [Rhizobium sp. CRIBSB]